MLSINPNPCSSGKAFNNPGNWFSSVATTCAVATRACPCNFACGAINLSNPAS
ncbi:hypothetical protein D3C71_1880750 [compost metagenome]